MLAFEDADIVPNAISSLKESKNLYKDTPDRRIFQSQDPFGPPKSRAVVPVLADFDVAEKTGFEAHIIQPVFYRAPEVMLGWGWRDKADIWNLGLVVRAHNGNTAGNNVSTNSKCRYGPSAVVVISSPHRPAKMGRTTLPSIWPR